MRKALALGLGALALTQAPANAGSNDGNQLLSDCTSKYQYLEGMCLGLTIGYFEAMQTNYTCSKFSGNVTRKQVRGVVVKFLENNPADRHLPGVILSYRAFYVAFDCKEKAAF